MKIFYLFITFISLFSNSYASDLSHWKMPEHIPVPSNNPQNDAKVKLGKILFFDKRLSSTDKISCATCHNPSYAWCDLKSVAVGVYNRSGRRNTPTILNSAYLESFFHDGRAKSLEEQAAGPIEAQVEMNMPLDKLVKKLQNIEGYKKLFYDAFGSSEISKDKILKALASFERTIITNNTPFNRWINGDKNAISKIAQEGFEIFKDKGRCDSCHNGFNFTNESFNNIGLGDKKDLGVYEITKSKSKIWYGAFKTPTLIAVEQTPPYFHNGSVNSLKEAVKICGNGGKKPVKIRSPFFRDRNLDEYDINAVVEFLKTLTPAPLDIKPPNKFPK